MKKISINDLDSLGIQRLSRIALKLVSGGNEICPPELVRCGDICVLPQDCNESSGCSESGCTGICFGADHTMGRCYKNYIGDCQCNLE